jgi:hypothetical protein
VRRVLLQLAPVLHLTRISTAFAVVANTWFVILWTRANPEHEVGSAALPGGGGASGRLWPALAAGALVALGLYAFGTALNDILDVRRDRMLKPERPLATGRISIEAAVALVAGTLIAAVLGATLFGTRGVLMTLLVAAAILIYNAAGKFIPAIGLVVVGLIFAGHMVIPNLELRFLWPVWLVMTHALVVRAVTHRMARKVPRISRRAMLAALLGWAFWSAAILWLQWERGKSGDGGAIWPSWVEPTAWIWPAALVVLFVLVSWRRVLHYGPGPRAAEKIDRYGALWLSLYAAAWLFGTDHVSEGVILLILAAAGLVGMTILRELYGLLEQPLGYRR